MGKVSMTNTIHYQRFLTPIATCGCTPKNLHLSKDLDEVTCKRCLQYAHKVRPKTPKNGYFSDGSKVPPCTPSTDEYISAHHGGY